MTLVKRTITSTVLGIFIAVGVLGVSQIYTAQTAQAQFSDSESIFTDVETAESQDQKLILKNLIQTILGFLGVLSIVLLLLGGSKWMIAGGNDEASQDAKKLFFSGFIGLALVISIWAITMFVLKSITESAL